MSQKKSDGFEEMREYIVEDESRLLRKLNQLSITDDIYFEKYGLEW